MKRLILAIAMLAYFAVPAVASVDKEPAEVRPHSERSATAHVSKWRKTPAQTRRIPIGSLATIFLITVKIAAAIKQNGAAPASRENRGPRAIATGAQQR